MRACGKIINLQTKLDHTPLTGNIGISHTRWATHGKPIESNAHPHIAADQIAIVHNGIIENYHHLRQDLNQKGISLSSDTDTEVIAHLIQQNTSAHRPFIEAVKATTKQLQGAYAIAILQKDDPTTLTICKHGSPLVIGLGINENFVASDALSLIPVTHRFIYLDDGDIATLTKDKVTIIDKNGHTVSHDVVELNPQTISHQKDGYKHYMRKEIDEQPTAFQNTLKLVTQNNSFNLDQLLAQSAKTIIKSAQRVQIVACGTSYHAGLVAKYWLEQYLQIPVDVEIASEIRYREHPIMANTLLVVISQSGETADTLSALKDAKSKPYLATLAICNVKTSNMVRHADFTIITSAGPEIGVASTKAFTTQLMSLYLLMCYLEAEKTPTLSPTLKHLQKDIQQCALLADKILSLADKIEAIAQHFTDKKNALFLARGTLYPIALEGALKLKEISYINAQAYPGGELKHGPIALIDQEMPVIAVVANNHLLDKVKANLQEVHARGGELIVITEKSIAQQFGFTEHVIEIDAHIPESIAPIIYTIPLQLFAYFVAVAKGTDVDQPRNLAKSVTVE